MKGVYLMVDPEIVLEVRCLRGKLVPTREGNIPWFDDPSSFVVKIDQGEIAMTPASMTSLLNKYVFNGPDAPVEDVKIEIRDGHIHQEATLRKKVKVKSMVEGDLSVTPEGDIRLHPDKIKAEGLPVKGLLDLFDIELSEMIKSQASKGVSLDKNDFILDPERLLPSPKIAGRVTAVRLERPHRSDLRRWLRLRAAQARISGRRALPFLPRRRAELRQAHHARGRSSDHRRRSEGSLPVLPQGDLKQLVASTSKTMPDKGLVVYMPDYDEAGK